MHKFLETLEKLASWKVLILVFAGSLILYGNTLWNDYALDDAIVITQNGFTKQGVDGISKILTTDSFTGFFGTQKNLVSGGRYRPLSVVSFGIPALWSKASHEPPLEHPFLCTDSFSLLLGGFPSFKEPIPSTGKIYCNNIGLFIFAAPFAYRGGCKY